MEFLKRNWGIFVVLSFSIFSIVPFFHSGFFPMHDDTQVARVYEMGKALRDGMFPVRWVQDLGYGYGYPIFNFYAPFPYYLGGFLTLVGFDALAATKITLIIGILLSGITMYYLVRSFLGQIPAVASSLIYVYFPYHAVNIYVRGALGELFAYAFLPLVLWGLLKLNSRAKISLTENFIWIVTASISIALVTLSHNLTAFMLLFFILTFFIITIIISEYRKNLIYVYILSLSLGFSLSAFYAVPAIAEMKYTNVLSQIGGSADYKDHFICFEQLWNGLWGYGGSASGCIDGMSFKLGKLNIILSITSLIILLYLLGRKKFVHENQFLYFSAAVGLLLSIFMTLQASQLIWKNIPYMSFLQYPWRFLNFTGLFLSILVGFMVFYSSKIWKERNLIVVVSTIIVVLTIFYNAKLFKPQFYFDRNSSFYTDESYLKWTASKISDEYMPSNFRKPYNPSELPNSKIQIVEGSGSFNLPIQKTRNLISHLDLTNYSVVKVNIPYFPAWKFYLNGGEKSYRVGNDGLYLSVPGGKSTLDIRFEQTAAEKFGNVVSVISILLLVFGEIFLRRFRKIRFLK